MGGGPVIFWDFDYTLALRGAHAMDEDRHPFFRPLTRRRVRAETLEFDRLDELRASRQRRAFLAD